MEGFCSVKTHDLILPRWAARARAEGRMTQRRVIVGPQPPASSDVMVHNSKVPGTWWAGKSESFASSPPIRDFVMTTNVAVGSRWKCPFGQTGDRIRWLTGWATHKAFDRTKARNVPDAGFWSYLNPNPKPEGSGKLRSALSMPSFLRDRMPVDEVVSVRCEQVQKITEEDIVKEGCFFNGSSWSFLENPKDGYCASAWSSRIYVYAKMWNRIHGRGAWERNDWVWICELKPITP